MIERIFFVAALIIITIPTFAHADEKWHQDPFASDVEWRELSGALQSSNHPLTIEQINQLGFVRDTTDQKTVWGLVESTSHERNVNCMKAFSHVHFCRCLGEKLPVFLSFEEYVAIITGTITQVNSSNMKAEEKQRLVDNTIKAREQCVASTLNHQ